MQEINKQRIYCTFEDSVRMVGLVSISENWVLRFAQRTSYLQRIILGSSDRESSLPGGNFNGFK